jgi:hypothetical protein
MNLKDTRLIESNKKATLKRFECLDNFPNYFYSIHYSQVHKGSILLKHGSFSKNDENKLRELYSEELNNSGGGI